MKVLKFGLATFAGLAVLASASPATALTGSGTVSFQFTRFEGPFARSAGDPYNRSSWYDIGTVNGRMPNQAVNPPYVFAGPHAGTFIYGYDYGLSGSTVDFDYLGGNLAPNQLSFTPAAFTNVAQGQNVKLGTIRFLNGGWLGGGETAAFNRASTFQFVLTTTSSTPEFNQTLRGIISLSVNAPAVNDCSVRAGQDAEADWINISAVGSFAQTNAFRVYDSYCAPAGELSSGSADMIFQFNSLHYIGFANPVNGFLTDGNGPLPAALPPPPPPPPPPPAVPEPASWALLIAGFGLTGAALRRRSSMPRIGA